MKAEVEIGNKKYNVDFSKGIDISIPLNFNGDQPNTYGVDSASSKPYQDDNFIGDTRKGGPCNFETYSFTCHCNGTHTECIGHITDERIDVLSSLNEEMIPATLISITPKSAEENYIPALNTEDLVITKEDLELQLKDINSAFLRGLIIRTLPNFESKRSRDYMKDAPAFFSIDAMQYIVSLGVEHLLVDIPSVDRLLDDGNLMAHNIFWETKGKELNLNAKNKTITEMIFVAENIKDRRYLLNLQIPAFVSDAAPSRPILYKANDL
ncbi:MAG: cyclase family protein [Bacteroidota bacterium]|nr:cyclase family protein [Bacteroidota bacterium]